MAEPRRCFTIFRLSHVRRDEESTYGPEQRLPAMDVSPSTSEVDPVLKNLAGKKNAAQQQVSRRQLETARRGPRSEACARRASMPADAEQQDQPIIARLVAVDRRPSSSPTAQLPRLVRSASETARCP